MFSPKRLIVCLILCAAPGLAIPASTAFAQDAAQSTYKIGIVDFREVLRSYDKREQAYKKLEEEMKALQTRLDAAANEVEAMKKNYETSKDLSEDARRDLEETIETKAADFKNQMQKDQRAIDRKEQEILQEVIGDIRSVIEEIGLSGNYHLILDANSPNPPRGGVLFYSKTIDITSEVLARLNKAK